MSGVPRVPEPSDGDERGLLLGWLAFHRGALAAKCAGLDAGQLATRSAPPSPLSLLGLVGRGCSRDVRASRGAVLGGAATRPQQRGKGAQSALLDRCLREAARAGCDLAVATVTPGTASARNLVRAGFTILPRPVWRLDPSGR